MLNLFRLYWRFDRLWFILMILFFLVFSTFMLAITWRDQPVTDVWGFVHGNREEQETDAATMRLLDWVFLFPLMMWISNSLNVFDIYRMHKLHWLLPASQREKYASRIAFNLCLTVVFILITTLIIDWVRVPLSSILSIDQPIERGWALPLLTWYFRWPSVVFYLWLMTGCYYLSARSKKITFVAIVPLGLNAVYMFIALYLDTFWDWAPYLAVVLAVATVINIRLGYRRFQQLEMVLQFTPKVL